MVESKQPLRIHIGKDLEIILFNGNVVGMLQAFEFHYAEGEILSTKFSCVGCFPILQQVAPDTVLSNSAFPFRIYVGQTIEEGHVIPTLDAWFCGHHISGIQKLDIVLDAHEKRQIALHFAKDPQPPRELIDALVELNVEVIL
jgi:hypothetical protein